MKKGSAVTVSFAIVIMALVAVVGLSVMIARSGSLEGARSFATGGLILWGLIATFVVFSLVDRAE